MTIEKMKKARETADALARSQGKNSIEDLVNPIREGLNSEDMVQQELARDLARGTVKQLTQLLLKQELFQTDVAPYIKWVDVFNDGMVKEGNGKLYDFNHATGSEQWDEAEFIPDALSVPDVDEFKITMYQANGQLNSTQAYQFKKKLVYRDLDWIPYFKRGNLVQFVAQLQAQLQKTWDMFIFDKIVRKIKGTTFKKQVDGTAANAFDAWTTEILPEIRKMLTLSSDYNVNSSSTALVAASASELVVLAHPKTIQVLQAGLKSQLFAPNLLNMQGVIDENNFIDCGRELTISTNNSDTKITAGTNYYIPENTIYVLSKQALKHISQVHAVEIQHFASNIATELVLHKWGALDFLPWGMCFKYTNNNLNTLP